MRTLVTFRCGGQLCALDRAAVREIAPVPELSIPPSLPQSVEGVMNLAGQAIIVVDLARLLDVAPAPDIDPLYRHIIVVDTGDGFLAVLVDRVLDIVRVGADLLVPVPEHTSVNNLVVAQTASLHLLDPGRLLLAAERARFADIQKSEQGRIDGLQA